MSLAFLFTMSAGARASQEVLYASVANNSSGEIDTIDASGNVQTFASGLNFPESMAFNLSGDLFVADNGAENGQGQIDEFSPSGALTVFAPGVSAGGLAVDSAGNVYVSNLTTGDIDKYNSEGILDTVPVAHLTTPGGLTFDSQGNLFAADMGSGASTGVIDKITPSGQLSIFASGLDAPTELRFDGSGNLLLTSFSDGTVLKYTSSGATGSTPFVSGLTSPAGLANDTSGNIFVVDFLASTIDEVSPDGTVRSPPFLSPINAYDLAFGPISISEPSTFASICLGLVSLGGFGMLRLRRRPVESIET